MGQNLSKIPYKLGHLRCHYVRETGTCQYNLIDTLRDHLYSRVTYITKKILGEASKQYIYWRYDMKTNLRHVVDYKSPLNTSDIHQLQTLLEHLISEIVTMQDKSNLSTMAHETTEDIMDTLIDIKVDLQKGREEWRK